MIFRGVLGALGTEYVVTSRTVATHVFMASAAARGLMKQADYAECARAPPLIYSVDLWT